MGCSSLTCSNISFFQISHWLSILATKSKANPVWCSLYPVSYELADIVFTIFFQHFILDFLLIFNAAVRTLAESQSLFVLSFEVRKTEQRCFFFN